MRKKKSVQPPEVVWREERKTLTLDGEPVLEYALSWPEVVGGGPGGRFITKYYARLAEVWRRRWGREVYILACLALAERRASSRPFTPWTGNLSGEVTFLADGLLSLRMDAAEVRGDGKPCLTTSGDVWRIREGAPCPVRELFPGDRGWKKSLAAQIVQQGNDRRAAGDCFLDQGWEARLSKLLPLGDCWLTEDGLALALPQCAAAPAAEGAPAFTVPLPPGAKNGPQKKKRKKSKNTLDISR